MALSGTSLSATDVLSMIASSPRMAVVALGVKDERQAEQLRRAHRRPQCLASPAAPNVVVCVVRELLNPHGVARRP
jgi:hypothetical protein